MLITDILKKYYLLLKFIQYKYLNKEKHIIALHKIGRVKKYLKNQACTKQST